MNVAETALPGIFRSIDPYRYRYTCTYYSSGCMCRILLRHRGQYECCEYFRISVFPPCFGYFDFFIVVSLARPSRSHASANCVCGDMQDFIEIPGSFEYRYLPVPGTRVLEYCNRFYFSITIMCSCLVVLTVNVFVLQYWYRSRVT